MSPDFDPYHVWLGIPPAEQPASYYRLLGLRPFEPTPNVIDNAYQRSITHLRTLLNGPLQLRLRTFEGQDARASAPRRSALGLGQAFFGVLSH